MEGGKHYSPDGWALLVATLKINVGLIVGSIGLFFVSQPLFVGSLLALVGITTVAVTQAPPRNAQGQLVVVVLLLFWIIGVVMTVGIKQL